MQKHMTNTVNYGVQRLCSIWVLSSGVYLTVHATQYYTRYGHMIMYTPTDVLRAVALPIIFSCFGSAGLLPPRWTTARRSLWLIGALTTLLYVLAFVSFMQQMPF